MCFLFELYIELNIGTFLFMTIIHEVCSFKNADIFVCFSGDWQDIFSDALFILFN